MSFIVTSAGAIAQNAPYSLGLSYSYTVDGEILIVQFSGSASSESAGAMISVDLTISDSVGYPTTGTASVYANCAGVHMALVPVIFSFDVPVEVIGGTLTFTVIPQTGTVCDENDRFNIFAWSLGPSS